MYNAHWYRRSKPERLPRSLDISVLLRTLRLTYESTPDATILSIILSIVQSLLPLLALMLMKRLIDLIQKAVTGGSGSGSVWVQLQPALPILLAAAGTSLCIVVVKAASEMVRETQTGFIARHISDLIHQQSMRVSISFYDRAELQDTLHRAQQESATRPLRILQSTMSIGQAVVSFTGLAVFLASLNVGIALILITSLLPGILLRLRSSNAYYSWHRSRTRTERESWYYHILLTFPEYAKDIRLFGLGKLFSRRFLDLSAKIQKERLSYTTKKAMLDASIQGLGVIVLFGSLAYIVAQTLAGRMTLGDMVIFQQAFQRAQSELLDIIRALVSLYEDTLFISSLFDFLDYEESPDSGISQAEKTAERGKAVQERSTPADLPVGTGIASLDSTAPDSGYALEFHDVSFRYPGMDRWVLSGMSLKIPRGKVVALVGENGSGKSTIVKLIARLYRQDSGIIRLDGSSLETFDPEVIRRRMSVVMQDFSRYYVSLRENIWFGDVHKDPQPSGIERAARDAGVLDFSQHYSSGLDAMLGRVHEGGKEPSGGEWQRIALARAFFRDASLVILDEPTSAMDARSEYELFESLRRLLEGRSALIVSHRFSTVRMADYIYVLESGRIVEEGSHEDLMDKKGLYAGLYTMQASAYR